MSKTEFDLFRHMLKEFSFLVLFRSIFNNDHNKNNKKTLRIKNEIFVFNEIC